MKKMIRKILSPFLLFLSLFCVFAIGYGSYIVAGYGMSSTSGTVSVTASEVIDNRMTIGDLTVDGNIVFGPSDGNNKGNIIDDGAGNPENLSTTISATIETTTTFSGAITFSIAPDSTDTSLSTAYSSAISSGYITDPIAGEGNGDTVVGDTINIVNVSSGSATGVTINPIDGNTSVGVSAVVSGSSTSGTTFTFTVTITVTYGWGTYFTYTNPAEADELNSPNYTYSQMISALDTMYSNLGSSFNLTAVIGAEVDATASGGETAETMIAKYDFSAWSSYTSAANSVSDEEFAATYTGGSTGSDPFSTITAQTYMYRGNGTSNGAFTYNYGLIRMGASSSVGTFTLSFTEGTGITKAVISAHAWTTGASSASNRMYLTVNSSEAQAASTTGTAESLTFTFDSSDTITISTTSSGYRGFIFSIEFY